MSHNGAGLQVVMKLGLSEQPGVLSIKQENESHAENVNVIEC